MEWIQFNRKFTGGMTPKKYSEILMNSKIALVPEGYLSDISFRFFEAAKFGCVIFTNELYDYWFFKMFPGYELKSWHNLHKKIVNILSDKSLLSEMQKRTMSYYSKYCDEKATCEFIIKIIGTS